MDHFDAKGGAPTISYVQIRTLPLWEAGSVAKDDTDLNANFEIGVGIALNVWGASSSAAHSDQLSSINSERQFNCTTLQLRANYTVEMYFPAFACVVFVGSLVWSQAEGIRTKLYSTVFHPSFSLLPFTHAHRSMSSWAV